MKKLLLSGLFAGIAIVAMSKKSEKEIRELEAEMRQHFKDKGQPMDPDSVFMFDDKYGAGFFEPGDLIESSAHKDGDNDIFEETKCDHGEK